MNKVTLMGRLTSDPNVRRYNGDKLMAQYTLAINRRFKREETDFIQCTAFGKTAEFAEKYFKKGQMISVIARLQTNNYTDKNGKKVYGMEVIVEEQYFAGNKMANTSAAAQNPPAQKKAPADADGFFPIDTSIEDDDLPF